MSFGNSVVNHTSTLRFQIAELIFSFLGALIAGTKYLADRNHYDLPCTVGGGCEVVSSSAYSHILVLGFNIPVALLGLVGYFLILTIVTIRMGSDSPQTARLALWLQTLITAGGFAYSWFLQYIAHFELDAFCVWCFSSACAMTLLFIVTTTDLVRNKRELI